MRITRRSADDICLAPGKDASGINERWSRRELEGGWGALLGEGGEEDVGDGDDVNDDG
jgi:hypothetical protein